MIYFDNAATTFPKPVSVINSTVTALKSYSFNSGRGGYKESIRASKVIYSVREKIGNMFSFLPSNVVFTKNCTEALNIAIKGSVKKGDHIIISSLEHNSVSRVVESLKQQGIITYDIAPFSFDENETIKGFEGLIKDNTKVVVCMHSSNAFGVTFPIKKIGEMCHRRGIRFIVDGAQGAGVANINARTDNIDILCCPGHKCLYGNMGIGFIAFAENVFLSTLMEGGTGSESLSLYQPEYAPDRFEVGTLNNSGIISLGKGIDHISYVGMENIYKKELSLCQMIYEALSKIRDIKLYTPYPESEKSMPILSFNFADYPSEKTASILANKGVCTRGGFHCSPLAHRHFGTLDTGTVRVSLGAFNTRQECNSFVDIIKKL